MVQDPLTLLVLHNAIAVIIAAMVVRLNFYLLFTAIVSVGAALFATWRLRSLYAVVELSWFACLRDPCAALYDPAMYDTMRRSQDALAAFVLIALYVSPLTLAYFTAWQWRPPSVGGRLQCHQVRLGIAFWAASGGCLMLGIHSWLSTQQIAFYPVVVAAICLALRPVRVLRAYWRRLQRDKRLSEARHRLRIGNAFDSALYLAGVHERLPTTDITVKCNGDGT